MPERRKQNRTLAAQAAQMRKMAQRFKTMKEQGITGPDGQSMGDYLREKTEESMSVEGKGENKKRSKERNTHKSIDR